MSIPQVDAENPAELSPGPLNIVDLNAPHSFLCNPALAGSWDQHDAACSARGRLLRGLVLVTLQVFGVGTHAALSQSAAAVSSEPSAVIPTATIGLEEIERGMKGYGLSVFAGTQLERFDVKVVGKLENLNPGLSFIMAELEGQDLERTGVVAGMSGSPVYLDGRLAGAVAFSWNFSQGALAGITPIAAMRALSDLPSDGAIASNPAPVSQGATFSDQLLPDARPEQPASGAAPDQLARLLDGDWQPLLQRGHQREDLSGWMRASAGLEFFQSAALNGAASALHWTSSGFDAATHGLLQQALPGSWVHAAGSVAGRADNESQLPPLESGGPVAALLVDGDLQVAVNGTITERSGDQVLAFGHPYLGLGPVSLPMAKAEVVTVVSSQVSSFKISNVGEVVGAFDEDRLPGMRGTVGAVANTTPLEITVRHVDEGEHSFSMRLADLEPMRPMLVASTVLQAIDSASRSAGKGGIDLNARFAFADRAALEVQQSFDGTGAPIDAAIYLLQVVAYIELNALEDVPLESISVEIEQSNSIRVQQLIDAFADRRTARPGDQVAVRLRFRDYRGAVTTETVSVALPSDLASGAYYLFVGDGVSIDAAQSRIEPVVNRTLDEGLERLGGLRSAKDLVLLGVQSGKGVVGESGSLPELPGSVRELWQGSSAGQVKGTSLVVRDHWSFTRDRPLSGVQRLDLVVLPKR